MLGDEMRALVVPEGQKLFTFDSKLLTAEKLNNGVKQMYFSVPQDFSYYAGQFVMASLHGQAEQEKVALPFLQAAVYEGGVECLLLKTAHQNKLYESKVGSMLNITGPYGDCFVNTDTAVNKPIGMVGMGTGVAAVGSMAKYLLNNNFLRPLHVLLVFADEQAVILANEWGELVKEYPNLQYTVLIKKALASTDAVKSLLQPLVDAALKPGGTLYVSGGNQFIQLVSDVAVADSYENARFHMGVI